MKINLRTHKDPTGMTAKQAVAAAELRFTKHPTLGVVYANSVISVRVGPCGGQTVAAGRKTSRGCGYGHLQPCPGGVLVYSIVRMHTSMGLQFNCIESTGDSWADAIAKIDQRREEDRKRYAKPPVTKSVKRTRKGTR